jgi:hypothetical protein
VLELSVEKQVYRTRPDEASRVVVTIMHLRREYLSSDSGQRPSAERQACKGQVQACQRRSGDRTTLVATMIRRTVGRAPAMEPGVACSPGVRGMCNPEQVGWLGQPQVGLGPAFSKGQRGQTGSGHGARGSRSQRRSRRITACKYVLIAEHGWRL